MSVDVDVRDLIGRPGSYRHVQVKEPIGGLRTELAEVREDRPVEADLLMESVVEGILASGPVGGMMTYHCARCLTSFDGRFRIDVQEMFASETTGDDDQYPLGEGIVDLEPMIRDAVVTAMPFAPLCRPDCQGLCPRCGGDRNVGECSCGPDTDPRWSALADLRLTEGE